MQRAMIDPAPCCYDLASYSHNSAMVESGSMQVRGVTIIMLSVTSPSASLPQLLKHPPRRQRALCLINLAQYFSHVDN